MITRQHLPSTKTWTSEFGRHYTQEEADKRAIDQLLIWVNKEIAMVKEQEATIAMLSQQLADKKEIIRKLTQ